MIWTNERRTIILTIKCMGNMLPNNPFHCLISLYGINSKIKANKFNVVNVFIFKAKKKKEKKPIKKVQYHVYLFYFLINLTINFAHSTFFSILFHVKGLNVKPNPMFNKYINECRCIAYSELHLPVSACK